MRKWETRYNNDTIAVENEMTGERLYVNGELQDELLGTAERSRLWGQLPSGETIKVSIGSKGFKVQCRVFVNNKLVLSK
jgi:hypothetical protein